MFNALKYIRNLEAVGFQREQAEVQVQVVMDAMSSEFATKNDMADLRGDFAKLRVEFAELKGEFADLKGEFAELKGEFAELKGDFAKLRIEFAELRSEVRAMEFRITTRLGGLMVALLTLFHYWK